MGMISYAQNGEDVLLNRLFPPDYLGFYVDIGASDPVHLSITKHFYDRGWCGVNVEPAANFERLCAHRGRDINLNVAISAQAGRATLYDYPTARHYATLVGSVAQANERFAACVPREVETMPLSQLCEQYVKERVIDFMCIDVEGHERAVITSGDWDRFRPRVLVVESTFPHTARPTHHDWEPFLLEQDYRFAIFDGLNRFYVRGEDAHLLRQLEFSACVMDQYVPWFHQDLQEEYQRLLGKYQDLASQHQAFKVIHEGLATQHQALNATHQDLAAEHQTLRHRYESIFAAPFQFLEVLAAKNASLALRSGVMLASLLHRAAVRLPPAVRRPGRAVLGLGRRVPGFSNRRQ